MKIAYVDFWGGFDPIEFWITRLLRSKYEVEISDPFNSDLIIGSCFGNSIRLFEKSKAIKILFLGENVRPSYNFYDYSLSFDYSDNNNRNIRLPLWTLYVDWWGNKSEDLSLDELNYIFSPEDIYNRQNFACIVAGNPVKNRMEIYNKLNLYKKVDGYGFAFKNRYDGRKHDLLKNYRYNICFENSIYPGYCTEKLLQAKVAGCVPIYYGCKESENDFNEKCYLNLINYSMEEFIEKIIKIDDNKDEFIQIASEPLFSKKPDLNFLYDFFDKILNSH